MSSTATRKKRATSKRRRWTDTEIETLKSMVNNHCSMQQMIDAFGRNKSSIGSKVRSLGMKVNTRKRLSDTQKKQIKAYKKCISDARKYNKPLTIKETHELESYLKKYKISRWTSNKEFYEEMKKEKQKVFYVDSRTLVIGGRTIFVKGRTEVYADAHLTLEQVRKQYYKNRQK